MNRKTYGPSKHKEVGKSYAQGKNRGRGSVIDKPKAKSLRKASASEIKLGDATGKS